MVSPTYPNQQVSFKRAAAIVFAFKLFAHRVVSVSVAAGLLSQSSVSRALFSAFWVSFWMRWPESTVTMTFSKSFPILNRNVRTSQPSGNTCPLRLPVSSSSLSCFLSVCAASDVSARAAMNVKLVSLFLSLLLL